MPDGFFLETRLRRQSGFTLLELLITVAVLGIMAVIAVPSFEGLLNRWQLRSEANSLVATLTYARSEAIRRRTPVSLVASSSDGVWQVNVTANSESLRLATGNKGTSMHDFPSPLAFGLLGATDDCPSTCTLTLTHSSLDDSRRLDISPAGAITLASP